MPMRLNGTQPLPGLAIEERQTISPVTGWNTASCASRSRAVLAEYRLLFGVGGAASDSRCPTSSRRPAGTRPSAPSTKRFTRALVVAFASGNVGVRRAQVELHVMSADGSALYSAMR